MTPENRLFATLDVTVHQAFLKNMKVLLIDTVGFISDIPKTLMEAFSATLEDALIAVRKPYVPNIREVRSIQFVRCHWISFALKEVFSL